MNALSTLTIVGLLMPVSLSGSPTEVFNKDGKECICFDIKTIPAVYKVDSQVDKVAKVRI